MATEIFADERSTRFQLECDEIFSRHDGADKKHCTKNNFTAQHCNHKTRYTKAPPPTTFRFANWATERPRTERRYMHSAHHHKRAPSRPRTHTQVAFQRTHIHTTTNHRTYRRARTRRRRTHTDVVLAHINVHTHARAQTCANAARYDVSQFDDEVFFLVRRRLASATKRALVGTSAARTRMENGTGLVGQAQYARAIHGRRIPRYTAAASRGNVDNVDGVDGGGGLRRSTMLRRNARTLATVVGQGHFFSLFFPPLFYFEYGSV